MTTDLPLRHLSIRVPWHDAGWNGTVCADPVNNASCLRLHNIHARRDDRVEVELRSRRIDELKEFQQPPCVAERATFHGGLPDHPTGPAPVQGDVVRPPALPAYSRLNFRPIRHGRCRSDG